MVRQWKYSFLIPQCWIALILFLVFCSPAISIATAQPEVKSGKANAPEAKAAPTRRGPPPKPVMADPAQLETVQRMRRVVGEIRSQRRSVVASQEEGLVILVPFDAGAVIKKGEVLARLDSTLLELQFAEFEARLLEAEATIAVRQSELELAERDLISLADLSERGAAKPKEFRDAQSAVVSAKARLSGATRAAAFVRAQVQSISKRLEHQTVTAPFDGIIINKLTEVGEWVQEGGDIVEIIESGLVDAVMAVPETYINLVKLDMLVTVTLPAFPTLLEGRIRAIVPMGDARARTYPVKVELSDQGGLLKPLMTAEIWVPTGKLEQALTIRKDAILQNSGGPFVYVARQGSASMVPIRMLYSAGTERVVVAGPLGEGDLIIYEGNERLRPGAAVRVIEKTPAAGE